MLSGKGRRVFLAGLAAGVLLVAIVLALPRLAGHYLGWRVARATQGRVKLVNPTFTAGPGFKADLATFEPGPPFALRFALNEPVVHWRPAGRFSGQPYQLTLAAQGVMEGGVSREMDVTGRVSGNFSRGSYQVHNLRVRIKRLGELNLSGEIETKGAESRLKAIINDLSMEELARDLVFEGLPTAGLVGGEADIVLRRDGEKWTADKVDFQVAFTGLVFKQQFEIAPLSGTVAGVYDFTKETGLVRDAKITTETGGELVFDGTIGKEGFDFNFSAHALQLEDILEMLPDAVREKMGLRVDELEGRAFYSVPEERFFSSAAFRFQSADGYGELNRFGREGEAGGALGAQLNLKGLDLLPLSRLYGEGAEISGVADLECEVRATAAGLESVRVSLETLPVRGVRQYLNFRAVKYLLALSMDSPVRFLSDADYGYRKIAGEAIYRDGYLTLLGRARQEADQSYIMLGTVFGRHINVAIDPRNNTVRLSDLAQRVSRLSEATVTY